MICKLHKTLEGQIIIALCDSELLGKKFTQDELQLDLTSDFYKGEKKTEQETLNLIKEAYIINAVGKTCIEFLLKNKLIEQQNIITIAGIPHAQCVIVRE
jgi:hypothetical protein